MERLIGKDDFQESCKKYDEGYYKDKLNEGLEFQDYVVTLLQKHGIILMGHASKKYQIERGENLWGAEIKYDQRRKKTGNVYIETHEKSDPRNHSWIPSGIYRADNTWLYIIGDEIEIHIHSIKYLRYLHHKTQKKGNYRSVTIATSKGFLLPLKDSRKYSLVRFVKKSEEDMELVIGRELEESQTKGNV